MASESNISLIDINTSCEKIQIGDFVVIQKQNFRKLHKVKSSGTITLGKDIIELDEIIGKSYYTTFRMVLKANQSKIFTLEEESNFVQSLESNVNIDKSGVDNRSIIDDGMSQKLSSEDILELRNNVSSSVNIVETLLSNSKSFSKKTEYSQRKYIKKKEKKYFEYVQIFKPTVRILTDIYYRLDPAKIQGLRMDDLSQILTYANIYSDSNSILYDSGSNGLAMAAIVNAIGRNTSGTLIHMHPGNVCQKEAFQALNFTMEQKQRCVNVCIYSVLRCYYQEFKLDVQNPVILKDSDPSIINDDASSKDPKEEDICAVADENDKCIGNTEIMNVNTKRKLNQTDFGSPDAKKPCWQKDNERACQIIKNKVDSLVIITKEYPSTITHELLKFLKYGRSFVVYNTLREPLQQLYTELKNKGNIIALKLSNTFVRYHQVLENRTHPDINMTTGGYILTGVIIDTKSNA